MKKLLIVAVVALLALALVACGGEETPATTKGEGAVTTPAATTPAATQPKATEPVATQPKATEPGTVVTTTPNSTTTPVSSTETPGVTTPVLEGIDILNGDDEDNWALVAALDGLNVGMFENHHAALDMNWAYVVKFQECGNTIYEDLVFTEGEGDSAVGVQNPDYKWVLTIDGTVYEIERLSIYHGITWGYVRMDLGADFKLKAADEDGYVRYNEIVLRIYDTSNNDEPVYYAWMTDPANNGVHEFLPPAPIEMVVDPSRNPDDKEVTGATPYDGPAGFTGELYTNLFDYKDGVLAVGTKLCTDDCETAIVWYYDNPVYITSFSLVGANDDASYYDRIVTKFQLLGSADGKDGTWTTILDVDGDAVEEGNGVNYAERNFKVTTPAEYKYFKLVPVGYTKYQLSAVIVWTQE